MKKKLKLVYDQLWNRVEFEVCGQLGNKVKNQVGNKVWNQLKDKVEDQIWDKVGDRIRTCTE